MIKMKKIALILSGPTHEYFDPVRFIGNASSGLMGKAIAEEAVRRGYFVVFVSGPVPDSNLPDLASNGDIHRVLSAEDMLFKASELFPSASLAVFAAAVADYAPAEKWDEKIAKSDDALVLHLRPTPDIARTLCSTKQPGQLAVGFALQTSEGENQARRKLESKNLDGIILNTPASLGSSHGEFSFLSAGAGTFEHWGRIAKKECAVRILDAVESLSAR